jgi:hypothetical protein
MQVLVILTNINVRHEVAGRPRLSGTMHLLLFLRGDFLSGIIADSPAFPKNLHIQAA